MKIRQNDTVLVIVGNDRGKNGKVRFAYPKDETRLVQGIDFLTNHAQSTGQVTQDGIIHVEAPLKRSHGRFLCNKCNHPTRIGFHFLEDGKKVRFCKACSEVID